jgi:hypothetical protein
MSSIQGIGAQATALQILRARQGFAPQPTRAAQPEASQFEIDSYEPAEAELPAAPASRNNPLDRLPFTEIQAIAERAGYVGVTQRDIQRAYARGESLLVDYTA